MGFGQQSGPPASAKQLSVLRSLLQAAGHEDFRTARHHFGLTQRQAAGRFTSGEASELIERLGGAEATDRPPASLGDVPSEVLAHELNRRGWIAVPPP